MDGKVEMEENERDRKLDQWLDETLSQYSAAEPRLGLEQRVLKHVHAEQPARARWNLWRWMPAFAALAVAVVVAIALAPSAIRKQEQAGAVKSKSGQAEVATYDAPANSSEEAEFQEQTKIGERVQISPGVAMRSPQKRVAKSVVAEAVVAEPPVPTKRELRVRTELDEALAGQPSAPVNIFTAQHADERPSDGVVVNGKLVSGQKPEFIDAPSKATTPAVVEATAPSGIVGTEKVTSFEAIAIAPKARKPKKSESASRPDSGSFEIYGVKVRNEIVHVPIGPIQQFPSPVPLSEQEKSVLAAAPRLKDKSPKNENGEISPIQIKNVEIAPLEAPKK